MKKLLVSAVILSGLLFANVAEADSRSNWRSAGKILGGVAIGYVIGSSQHSSPPPSYTYREVQVVYVNPYDTPRYCPDREQEYREYRARMEYERREREYREYRERVERERREREYREYREQQEREYREYVERREREARYRCR